MMELRVLAPSDEAAFVAFSRRYRLERGGERLSLRLNPDELPFMDFYHLLRSLERRETVPAGEALSRSYMIWIDGEIVGAMALRWEDTDFVLNHAGHIGYCVAPWMRRRGIATEALGLMLPLARAMGLSRVLLICDPDNLASRRVIRKNGGVLDRCDGHKEFYWIAL